MGKKLSLISILLIIPLLTFCQNTDSILIKQSLHKHILNSDTPSFVILLATTDCFKCDLTLSNAVEVLKSEGMQSSFKKYIISDNYPYAKKFDSENNLNSEIIYDNDLFSKMPSGLKSFIALSSKENYSLIGIKDINDSILSDILHSYVKDSVIMEVKDSIINHNHFSAIACKYGYAIFDDLMQEGLLIYNNKTTVYTSPEFTDSVVLNNLPDRVDKSRFEKVSYKKNVELSLHNNIPLIHANTISNYDSNIFFVFSVNRFYRDKKGASDDYGVFTTYFIAPKKINSSFDYDSVFNINSYKKIYYIDSFSYKNEVYPLGIWVGYHPIFINDSTFQINVAHLNRQTGDHNFGGLATVCLQSNGFTKMIGLDTTAKEGIIINNRMKYNGNKFFIYKETLDESKNIGIIKVKKE